MPTYFVSFTAEAPTTYSPVSTMTAVEADSPQAAVEVLLATGRVPQISGLKWANVAIEVHQNGVPARVMRFAIHAERGVAIDCRRET
jgi:pyruvate/2-oxoglutarate dehydrogenase complex dihydrolipoamide dehydrogenase (E3) component